MMKKKRRYPLVIWVVLGGLFGFTIFDDLVLAVIFGIGVGGFLGLLFSDS